MLHAFCPEHFGIGDRNVDGHVLQALGAFLRRHDDLAWHRRIGGLHVRCRRCRDIARGSVITLELPHIIVHDPVYWRILAGIAVNKKPVWMTFTPCMFHQYLKFSRLLFEHPFPETWEPPIGYREFTILFNKQPIEYKMIEWDPIKLDFFWPEGGRLIKERMLDLEVYENSKPVEMQTALRDAGLMNPTGDILVERILDATRRPRPRTDHPNQSGYSRRDDHSFPSRRPRRSSPAVNRHPNGFSAADAFGQRRTRSPDRVSSSHHNDHRINQEPPSRPSYLPVCTRVDTPMLLLSGGPMREIAIVPTDTYLVDGSWMNLVVPANSLQAGTNNTTPSITNNASITPVNTTPATNQTANVVASTSQQSHVAPPPPVPDTTSINSIQFVLAAIDSAIASDSSTISNPDINMSDNSFGLLPYPN